MKKVVMRADFSTSGNVEWVLDVDDGTSEDEILDIAQREIEDLLIEDLLNMDTNWDGVRVEHVEDVGKPRKEPWD